MLETLYHGSDIILEHPKPDGGNPYNDYGKGLYCTKNRDLAGEWACTNARGGFINRYEIKTEGLNLLYLQEEPYTILSWLALLTDNRIVRAATPVMRQGLHFLQANYLPDISDADIVIGYRADDSYFSFARAFVSNQITVSQLERAMHLGELGLQYVLKSKKAFSKLCFMDAEPADKTVYYPKRKQRDELARDRFEKILLEEEDGIYIRDLMRKGR